MIELKATTNHPKEQTMQDLIDIEEMLWCEECKQHTFDECTHEQDLDFW